jgi:hypothetical protein
MHVYTFHRFLNVKYGMTTQWTTHTNAVQEVPLQFPSDCATTDVRQIIDTVQIMGICLHLLIGVIICGVHGNMVYVTIHILWCNLREYSRIYFQYFKMNCVTCQMLRETTRPASWVEVSTSRCFTELKFDLRVMKLP